MRTREKIRISNAFKRGMSVLEIFAFYKCVRSVGAVEDAIRESMKQNEKDQGLDAPRKN